MIKRQIVKYNFYILVIFLADIFIESCKKSVQLISFPILLITQNPTVKKRHLSDSASVTIKLKSLFSNKELILDNLPIKVDHVVMLIALERDQYYALRY